MVKKTGGVLSVSVRACVRVSARACMRVSARACVRVCVHVLEYSCACARACVCMCVCLHADVQTCAYVCSIFICARTCGTNITIAMQ